MSTSLTFGDLQSALWTERRWSVMGNNKGLAG